MIRWLIALIFLGTITPALRADDEQPRLWQLSGYLPYTEDRPGRRVWLTIEGNTIKRLSYGENRPHTERAPALILKTHDIIFPGLIDMHNHIKSNALSLWQGGRSQFKNRFEWRVNKEQKQAVRVTMNAVKGDVACAAVRWAEIKALTGGATGIQGLGYNQRCGEQFGIKNLGIPGEYVEGQKARDEGNIVQPFYLDSVYTKHILAHWNNPTDAIDTCLQDTKDATAYDKAFATGLEELGICRWLQTARTSQRTNEVALKLALGEDNVAKITSGSDAKAVDWSTMTVKSAFAAAQVKARDLDAQIKQTEKFVQRFVDGEDNSDAALFKLMTTNSENFPPVYAVQGLKQSMLDYIANVETAQRWQIRQRLADPNAMPVITHLAEGLRGDDYNRSEFSIMRSMDMLGPRMVIIHGMGITPAELNYMGSQNMSLVWSPFSNLLYYGDTLKLAEVKKAKINLTLGSDWSVGGTKHLLDEMRVAKAVAAQQGVRLSDRELVMMATKNAAIALNLFDRKVIGRVATGYQADFTLISANKYFTKPYKALTASTQKDVRLVVVNGEPVYGDPLTLDIVAAQFGDKEQGHKLQLIPEDPTKCGFQKALRITTASPLDRRMREEGAPYDITKVSDMKAMLQESIAKLKAEVQAAEEAGQPLRLSGVHATADAMLDLDPIFNCEDDDYQTTLANFFTEVLPHNIAQREATRAEFGLEDDFSPVRNWEDLEEVKTLPFL